jgi:hypothetical protein
MAIHRETPEELLHKVLDKGTDTPYSEYATTPQVIEPQIRNVIERPGGLVRKRKGFTSSKLAVNVDRLREAGWYCHWINDTPGRVQEALDIGYVFVTLHEVEATPTYGAPTADAGTRVCRRVGTNENGTELLAYLMKTSIEFHEENMAQTQIPCDRVDAQIRSGVIRQSDGGEGAGQVDPESGTAFYRSVNYGNRSR